MAALSRSAGSALFSAALMASEASGFARSDGDSILAPRSVRFEKICPYSTRDSNARNGDSSQVFSAAAAQATTKMYLGSIAIGLPR